MALIPEYEKYHALGPKDVGITSGMTIEVVRQTNRTGEQICVKVPVYGDESRTQLNDRLQMAYSILQDRMEDENKAVSWQNRRLDIQRRAAEKLKRKEVDLRASLKDIEKEAKRLQSVLNNKNAPNKSEAAIHLAEVREREKEIWAKYKESVAPFMTLIEHAKLELEQNKELPYEGKSLEQLLEENPDAKALPVVEPMPDTEESASPASPEA